MLSEARAESLRRSVCRVRAQKVGSGYLVAPRLVATCAHVVEGLAVGDAVSLDFYQGGTATAILLRVDTPRDAALLQLAGPLDRAPLPLAAAALDGESFWGFGYPGVLAGQPGTLSGRVLAARLTLSGNVDVIELDCQQAKDDIRGWSGSPLFVGEVVVGHVRGYWPHAVTGNPLHNKALGVPAVAVRDLAPQDIALPPALNVYLRFLEQHTGSIQLQGFGKGVDVTARRIEDLYTPLRFQVPTGDLSNEPPARRRNIALPREERRGRLADILPAAAKLLVVGAPGSGKTTFLRLAACMLARDALGHLLGDGESTWREAYLGLSGREGCPLPVFVTLSLVGEALRKDEDPRSWTRDLLLRSAFPHEHEREAARLALESGDAVLLLDGLDEVADSTLRERLESVLKDALRSWSTARVLLTSRPFQTLSFEKLGFASAHVDAFDRAQIRHFLDRWVPLLPPPPEGMAAYRENLETQILGRDHIRELAETPVMLTCLCVVHWNERELPRGRAEAYDKIVKWLLEKQRAQRKERKYPQGLAAQGLRQLATWMTLNGKRTTIAIVDAARRIAEESPDHARKLGGSGDERIQELEKWLRWECTGSGLIQEVGGGTLKFWHLTFQEYLAAETLALWPAEGAERCYWPLVEKHLEDPQWAEVLALLPPCLVSHGEDKVTWLLERLIGLLGKSPDLATEGRVFAHLHRFLDPLRAYEDRYAVPEHIEATYEQLRHRVQGIFERGSFRQVPWKQRLVIAEALGEAGDYRLEVPFTKRFAPIAERADVALGLYPVTVGEYAEFIRHGGYAERRYWGAAWEHRTQEKWTEPRDWDSQKKIRNRPVTGVSSLEALAYCNYLRERWRMPFRLPTNAEWTKAATSEMGDYPWGQEEPTHELANYRASESAQRPTPVGIYPDGAGPRGHLDLAGNVWEWCVDTDDESVDMVTSLETVLAAPPARGRPMRGGCYRLDAFGLRSAYRYRLVDLVDGRSVLVGFRLCLSPASRFLGP